MAPSRKKRSKATSKNSLRQKQIDAFIESFDQEVERRIEKLRAGLKMLKENVNTMYDREMLRLPTALRDMNWITYCALGEDTTALEQLAMVGSDVKEINEMASKALRTPVRTVRKAKTKRPIEAIEEEAGPPVLPLRKRSRQEEEAPIPVAPAPEQKPPKGKQSSRKPPTAKRTRPPSSRLNQRASKGKLTTPVLARGAATTTQGVTPGFVPRFDSSVFKTPGLRAPAPHEPVFSVSANGSPLAGSSSDVFVTLPVGKGESIRVKASDLTEKDLQRLNPAALGSMKKLSAQILRLCK